MSLSRLWLQSLLRLSNLVEEVDLVSGFGSAAMTGQRVSV
jgi:hypothetical protein